MGPKSATCPRALLPRVVRRGYLKVCSAAGRSTRCHSCGTPCLPGCLNRCRSPSPRDRSPGTGQCSLSCRSSAQRAGAVVLCGCRNRRLTNRPHTSAVRPNQVLSIYSSVVDSFGLVPAAERSSVYPWPPHTNASQSTAAQGGTSDRRGLNETAGESERAALWEFNPQEEDSPRPPTRPQASRQAMIASAKRLPCELAACIEVPRQRFRFHH